MVKHIFRGATAALVALLHAATVRAQQPFDSSAWDIHAAESRVEPYRGRSALSYVTARRGSRAADS